MNSLCPVATGMLGTHGAGQVPSRAQQASPRHQNPPAPAFGRKQPSEPHLGCTSLHVRLCWFPLPHPVLDRRFLSRDHI